MRTAKLFGMIFLAALLMPKFGKCEIKIVDDHIEFKGEAGRTMKSLAISPEQTLTERNKTRRVHDKLKREITVDQRVFRHVKLSSDGHFALMAEGTTESYISDAPQLASLPEADRYIQLGSTNSVGLLDEHGKELWNIRLPPGEEAYSLRISSQGETSSVVYGSEGQTELTAVDKAGRKLISIRDSVNGCGIEPSHHEMESSGRFLIVGCSKSGSLPTTLLIDLKLRRTWSAPYAFHALRFIDSSHAKITHTEIDKSGRASIIKETINLEGLPWKPL